MSVSAGSTAEPAPDAKATVDPAPAPSIYDQIWGLTKLYENEQNPVLQSFEFTGRFQLDYARIDQADFDDLTIRRFRLGEKVKLFHDFSSRVEVDLSPEHGPVYTRLTYAYVSWSPAENFAITVGKQRAQFTMDGSTSSTDLLTTERGNLANNLWFPQEYIPAVNMRLDQGPWRYRLGVFTSGGANREFGNFDGEYFLLTTLGYDFAKRLGARAGLLAADYVYQEPDPHNTFTRPLNHIGSVHFQFDKGKWGLRTDLTGGIGYLRQSDLWGTMIMPQYMLTSRLQVVARYTFIQSADPNGVRFSRYEDRVVFGRGDQYQEFYAGLNYYFYGHKLKVQTGVQHAEMRDRAHDGGQYSGWAWSTGLRISW